MLETADDEVHGVDERAVGVEKKIGIVFHGHALVSNPLKTERMGGQVFSPHLGSLKASLRCLRKHLTAHLNSIESDLRTTRRHFKQSF